MKKVKRNKESMKNEDETIREKLMETLCSRGPRLKSRPVKLVFANPVTLYSPDTSTPTH